MVISHFAQHGGSQVRAAGEWFYAVSAGSFARAVTVAVEVAFAVEVAVAVSSAQRQLQ
jgi:hypothetical protein